MMNLLFVTFLYISVIFGGDGAQKCLHEYRSGKRVIKYGRRASATPDRDVYYPDDVVRFRCPQGYYFQSIYYRDHQEMWIKCLKDHRWLEDWPICRGPLENVTCENQYLTAESQGRYWQNQTVNEFHAMFYPKVPLYRYGQSLRFSCPDKSNIYKTSGLTVMTTKCLKDGEWSKEWPMCKGRTCKSKYVKNGIINDKNKKLSVGIVLDIKCKAGYHLWGPNRTRCQSNLQWSGYPQECVTLDQFRRNCKLDQRVMKIKHEGHRQKPYCHYSKGFRSHIERSSNHYKIAIGISVPMAVGFIIFIVTASFYVKHQRIKMSRERASYIRQQQRQNRMLLSLPSYEDAVKSVPTTPPPSFEETFGVCLLVPSEGNSLLPVEETVTTHTVTAVVDLPPQYHDSDAYPQSELPPEYTERAEQSPPAAHVSEEISSESPSEMPTNPTSDVTDETTTTESRCENTTPLLEQRSEEPSEEPSEEHSLSL